MPHDIEVDLLPGGIAVKAAKEGETGLVQYAGIATSEDGELLMRYLGFADQLLGQLRKSGHVYVPSQVDNFLAVIRRDRTATVYVNELKLVSKVRIARSFEKGEVIYKDDVVDIVEAKLGDANIPVDAGVILIVSNGWRKGVLFDFGPLGSDPQSVREYNIWESLGQIVARLMYQERFLISNEDWALLFASRWFPFVGLSNALIEDLLGHVRAGWGAAELLHRIRHHLLDKIDGFVESWAKKSQFANHVPLLERAVERFKSEDYMSCTAITYPTIEGVLRVHHVVRDPNGKRSQSSLSASAVAALMGNPFSLLLPDRFHEYLKQVFFAGFDEGNKLIRPSRNSVGHGVASASEYDLESAIIGLLTCHQMFHCLPTDSNTEV